MGPKYEFTDETMNYDGHLLHRIRRLSDGKLGGWIEKEENLSQDGNCWIDDDAKVYDDAYVCSNAIICDDVHVCDNAIVSENATGSGEAWICGNAKIYGYAHVHGSARVSENATVSGEAWIFGNARVYDNAKVFNNAHVYGNAKVYGDAWIYDIAQVYCNAKVYGDAEVYGSAKVYGNAEVRGDAKVFDDTSVNEEVSLNDSSKEVIQDFIYKVDDSNKLTTQTKYDSIDEFFSTSITNDIKLDTLVICTVDTKDSLIKLQKVEIEDKKIGYKYIVDITNENGDTFSIKSIIDSIEKFTRLLQSTIEALNSFPQFSKYTKDLENIL